MIGINHNILTYFIHINSLHKCIEYFLGETQLIKEFAEKMDKLLINKE